MAHPKRTLIDIRDDLYEVLDEVDPETGEYLHGWESIEALQMERREKRINTAIYIKGEREHVKALKEQKKRIDNAIRSIEGRCDYLKEMLMNDLDGETIKEPGIISVFYKNSQSVEIADGTELPDEFVKIERIPRKTELKEAILDGEIIDGVSIVDNVSMVIR